MKLSISGLMFMALLLTIPLCATDLCGSLSGVLTAAGNPYIATCDLSVDEGNTLTIEEGVQITFNADISFTVSGTLNVNGSALSPVIFTGSVTDGWNGMTVTGSATIRHSVFRYASQALQDSNAVCFDVTDSAFEFNSRGISVWWNFSSLYSNISRCSFSDNSNCGIWFTHADSNFTASDCVFDRNGVPADLEYCSFPTLSGFTVHENHVYANGIWMGTWYDDECNSNLVLTNAGCPYIFKTWPEGWHFSDYVTLTVEKGAIIKQDNSHVRVPKLFVNGTASEPVIFTSYTDDTCSGDTNANGPSQGAVGDAGTLEAEWSAIVQHAIFRYADFGLCGGDTPGFKVTDSIFESNTYGIASSATCTGSPEGKCIYDNLIVKNNNYGIAFSGSATGAVTHSDFLGNTKAVLIGATALPVLGDLNDGDTSNDGGNQFVCNTIAVDNDNTATLLAENNWWGDSPPDPALFQGAVDYTPYLASEIESRQPISCLKVDIVNISDIHLSWENLGSVCGYRVLRSAEAFQNFEDISGLLSTNEHTDTGAVNEEGILYYKIGIE